MDIVLVDENQTFYQALGYVSESWRRTVIEDGLPVSNNKNRKEIVFKILGNNMTVGYFFQNSTNALLNHQSSLESLYSRLGEHKKYLLKVWIYRGSIIVFEFSLHDYQIAFDVQFESERLAVDVIDRSRKLIFTYDGERLNFSKSIKYQLLQMTASNAIIYETTIQLINRFLRSIETMVEQQSTFFPYVISMRPEFWSRVEKQFLYWPNAPILWPATDGRKLNLDELTQSGELDLMVSTNNGQTALTRGEIGCYLSHMRLWKHILEENKLVTAIFEDDADIPADLMEWVGSAMHYFGMWDLVYLGYNWNPAVDAIQDVADFVLPKISDHYHVLIGYLITATGASKLIENALPIRMPVDCYVASQIKIGFKSWQTKESKVSPVSGTYSSTQIIR